MKQKQKKQQNDQYLPVQLGIPGEYIYLVNEQTELEKYITKQIDNQKVGILSIPESDKNSISFDSDTYTSKIGGFPDWLLNDAEIPTCPICSLSMMLMTQVFSPFDVVSRTRTGIPSILSTSASPARTRYMRSVFVFGCNESLCKSAPGSYVVIQQVVPESEGKLIPAGSTAPLDTEQEYLDSDLEAESGTDNVDEAVGEDTELVHGEGDDDSDKNGVSRSVDNLDAALNALAARLDREDAENDDSVDDAPDGFEDILTTTEVVPRAIETSIKPVTASLFDIDMNFSDDENVQMEELPARTLPTTALAKEKTEVAIQKNISTTKPINAAFSFGGFDAGNFSDSEDETKLEPDTKSEDSLSSLRALLDTRDAKLLQKQQKQKDNSEPELMVKPAPASVKKTIVPKKATFKPTGPFVGIFKPFYLAWDQEPASSISTSTDNHAEALLRQYLAEGDGDGDGDSLSALTTLLKTSTVSRGAGSSSSATEAEEEDDLDEDERMLSEGQRDFERFTARVERSPEQCLRYWPAGPGQALSMSRLETKKTSALPFGATSGLRGQCKVPSCVRCGGALSLEMQLMPKLLVELHPASAWEGSKARSAGKPRNEGMDWGLIDVYTCPRLCGKGLSTSGFCLVHSSI